MASEPPLILAFDTAAAHCAAVLVRGDARPRRAATRRWTAARPSGCCRCSRRCWPRRGSAGRRSTASRVCTGPGNFTGAAPRGGRRARPRAGARHARRSACQRFEALADRPAVTVVVIADKRGRFRAGLPRRRGARAAIRRPASAAGAAPGRGRRRRDRRAGRSRRAGADRRAPARKRAAARAALPAPGRRDAARRAGPGLLDDA